MQDFYESISTRRKIENDTILLKVEEGIVVTFLLQLLLLVGAVVIFSNRIYEMEP